MSFPVAIEINSESLLDNYNMYTQAIDGLDPIQPVSEDIKYLAGSLIGTRGASTPSPRYAEVSGFIKGSSNYDAHYYLDTLCELVGWGGDRYKEVLLKFYTFTPAGAPTSLSYAYRCIIDRVETDPSGPYFLASIIKIRLRFRVISYQHYLGTKTWDYAMSTSQKFIYFADADCKHGANQVMTRFRQGSGAAVSNARFIHFATHDDLVDWFGEATASGPIAMTEGAFGSPAGDFDSAYSNYVRYPGDLNLPIPGTKNITIFIRFQRKYSIGSAGWKTLFSDTNPYPGGIKICVMNTPESEIFFGDGTNYVAVSGASVKAAPQWNIIIARKTATQLKLTLATSSGVIADSATASADCAATGLYAFVGTGAYGADRSDCIIDEVAVWKHDLSDAAVTALSSLSYQEPMRYRFEQDLNRRLLFLVDFSRGLDAVCSRPTVIGSSSTMQGHELRVDSDRNQMRLLNTTTGLMVDDIANLMSTVGGITCQPSFPVIERYNRIMADVTGTPSGLTFYQTYMPRMRT